MLLESAQKDMRNVLLETGGKVILPVHWYNRKLGCIVFSLLLKKAELATYDLGYLGEEISKQSVESEAWFLLLLIVKYKRKDKLRKELLNTKDLAC